MVAQAIETPTAPSEEANLAPAQKAQTESQEAAVAPEPEAVASEVGQVEVAPEAAPAGMTREEAEQFFAEREARIRESEREAERNRRRTENARRAAQEKRDTEDRAELIDTVKAAFGARGVYDVPDDAVISAVERASRKRADQLATSMLDNVDAAWDYLTAPAYGKQAELDEMAEPAAKRLLPKVQHLIDTLRPQIEADARKGYVAESEIPAKVEAEIARRNAEKRQGEEEMKRVDGTAPSTRDDSAKAIVERVIAGTADQRDLDAYRNGDVKARYRRGEP